MTLLLVEQDVISIPKAMIKNLKRSIFIVFNFKLCTIFFLFLHFKNIQILYQNKDGKRFNISSRKLFPMV